MGDVTIFTPAPILTVTVEDHTDGPEIHIHAGGQGVWQARMLRRLDVRVTMCCVLTGETGTVLRHLLEDEGIHVAAIERAGRGSAYLHDRRGGERAVVAEEEGDPLARHELDELYGVVLREALASDSRIVVLSGPAGDEALPAETYRRLSADLRAAGASVVVDLAGERLAASVDGGVDVLKVSHEELAEDGLIASPTESEIVDAMRMLRERGAGTVIVTRADDPLLLMDSSGQIEVSSPRLQVADTRGAGDSLTAGVVAGLVRGETPREAVTLGAAAGALNVTRHGLGTGDREAIELLRGEVTVRDLPDDRAAVDQPVTGRVSPDGLAALADTTDEEDA